MIDDDKILLADGETIELFWRGTLNGSKKWRFHVSHAGADLSLDRKGTRIDVKLGDRYSNRVSGDVQFDVAVERSDELQGFLHRAGIQPV